MFAKIKAMFGAQDMTVGKPIMVVARFALPLLVGNLAQQLYSTVDSVVVGKYCSIARNGYNGVDALAAVGVSGPILHLLLVLFIAVSTGAGILVAQYFGAKDRKRLSICVGTSITMVTVAALCITALGIPLSRPLLTLIHTPEKYYALSAAYLQILFAGVIGSAFYNIVSGILRGLGDSFYPLVFLLVSAGLNIILDIWFVASLGWGVQGVAWATVIAQCVSGALCIVRLLRMKDVLDLNWGILKPRGDVCKKVLKLGLPSGVTQAVFSMAMIMVQNLTNQMGDFVPAISVTIMRVDGFAMLPAFTFGLAVSTYIGQNIGAGKSERIRPGIKATLTLALGFSAIVVAALFIFGPQLVAFFINESNTDPDVYETIVYLGGKGLRTLALGYLCMSVTQVFGGVLRAAGDTMSTMVISLITTVAVRVPLAYLMAYLNKSDAWPKGHPDALFQSMLISWVLGAVLNYLRYKQGKWKEIDLVGNGSRDAGEPCAEA